MNHHERLNIQDMDPAAYSAVYAMEDYIDARELEPKLTELIKIRASQVNGCALCLDMHARIARKHGEDQRRLDILSAWREAPSFFDERERAALALTEAVTLIGSDGVPDDIWNEVTRHFDQQSVVHLLMIIATINVWNRLAVATHWSLPN